MKKPILSIGYLSSVLALICTIEAFAQEAPGRDSSLPGVETRQAIETLQTVKPEARPEVLYLPRQSSERAPASHDFGASDETPNEEKTPFVVPNSMLLQFEQNVSADQIKSFLESKDAKILRTYPSIGAVHVETDLSKHFEAGNGDSRQEVVVKGLNDAIKEFESDPIIKNAAPDLMLTPKAGDEITNLLSPNNIEISNDSKEEIEDWGIADIQAGQLWKLPGATDGAVLGVMDVGFGRHDDLVFLGLPPNMPTHNHGNHVAAIACARHDSKGTRGVLPNCFIRAQVGDVFFENKEGDQQGNLMVTFSQILATLHEFVTTHDDVRTYNVSLGYNWRKNLQIDPDKQDSEELRTLIAAQGVFAVPLLELAQKEDKVIFSAAGNDSAGLSEPRSAKFASPFNWAAIIAREQGIESGIIVEAHDPNGNRAPFSNSGGHLSCPGVDVLSAVAFDSSSKPSKAAYGKMSGTSMAAPYCAAGHLLIRLVRPNYSGAEVISCMLKSGATSSSGTPMLQLSKAVEVCPEKKS